MLWLPLLVSFECNYFHVKEQQYEYLKNGGNSEDQSHWQPATTHSSRTVTAHEYLLQIIDIVDSVVLAGWDEFVSEVCVGEGEDFCWISTSTHNHLVLYPWTCNHKMQSTTFYKTTDFTRTAMSCLTSKKKKLNARVDPILGLCSWNNLSELTSIELLKKKTGSFVLFLALL